MEELGAFAKAVESQVQSGQQIRIEAGEEGQEEEIPEDGIEDVSGIQMHPVFAGAGVEFGSETEGGDGEDCKEEGGSRAEDRDFVDDVCVHFPEQQ